MKRTLILLALMLFLSSHAHAELVGYWNFDEGTDITAFDSSIYGNDGTLTGTGGLPEWTQGTSGFGLHFMRSNQVEVYIPDSPSLIPGSEFSIMAWVKFDDLIGQQTIYHKGIFSQFSKGADNTFQIGLDGLTGGGFFSGSLAKSGVWIHIAVIYN